MSILAMSRRRSIQRFRLPLRIGLPIMRQPENAIRFVNQ